MSLHRGDWMKIIGGTLLAMTGAGLAGAGPMAGMLAGGSAAGGAGAAGAGGAAALDTGLAGGTLGGAGVGAAGSGAAGVGAAHGLGSLISSGLITQGLGMGTSGAMGTPTETLTQPGQLPPLDDSPDPMALFDAIKKMKHQSGGLS